MIYTLPFINNFFFFKLLFFVFKFFSYSFLYIEFEAYLFVCFLKYTNYHFDTKTSESIYKQGNNTLFNYI